MYLPFLHIRIHPYICLSSHAIRTFVHRSFLIPRPFLHTTKPAAKKENFIDHTAIRTQISHITTRLRTCS